MEHTNRRCIHNHVISNCGSQRNHLKQRTTILPTRPCHPSQNGLGKSTFLIYNEIIYIILGENYRDISVAPRPNHRQIISKPCIHKSKLLSLQFKILLPNLLNGSHPGRQCLCNKRTQINAIQFVVAMLTQQPPPQG